MAQTPRGCRPHGPPACRCRGPRRPSGSGAAQKLHALQRIGLDLDVVVGAVGAQQPVLVLTDITAAGLERVHAVVEIAGIDARRVACGFAQCGHALGFELVARDHADRLRRFDQGCICLGGRDRTPGDKAADRTCGSFAGQAVLHGNGGQHDFGTAVCAGCGKRGLCLSAQAQAGQGAEQGQRWSAGYAGEWVVHDAVIK